MLGGARSSILPQGREYGLHRTRAPVDMRDQLQRVHGRSVVVCGATRLDAEPGALIGCQPPVEMWNGAPSAAAWLYAKVASHSDGLSEQKRTASRPHVVGEQEDCQPPGPGATLAWSGALMLHHVTSSPAHGCDSPVASVEAGRLSWSPDRSLCP